MAGPDSRRQFPIALARQVHLAVSRVLADGECVLIASLDLHIDNGRRVIGEHNSGAGRQPFPVRCDLDILPPGNGGL